MTDRRSFLKQVLGICSALPFVGALAKEDATDADLANACMNGTVRGTIKTGGMVKMEYNDSSGTGWIQLDQIGGDTSSSTIVFTQTTD